MPDFECFILCFVFNILALVSLDLLLSEIDIFELAFEFKKVTVDAICTVINLFFIYCNKHFRSTIIC